MLADSNLLYPVNTPSKTFCRRIVWHIMSTSCTRSCLPPDSRAHGVLHWNCTQVSGLAPGDRQCLLGQHTLQTGPHRMDGGKSTAQSSVRSMQVANLEKWHPAQHVVTESLSGAIVTQKIVCHGPSHPKLPQPSPGKHTGVAEFIFNGEHALTAGAHSNISAVCCMHDGAALVQKGAPDTGF